MEENRKPGGQFQTSDLHGIPWDRPSEGARRLRAVADMSNAVHLSDGSLDDIAEAMYGLVTHPDHEHPPEEWLPDIATEMLVNVARGRRPTQYDLLSDFVHVGPSPDGPLAQARAAQTQIRGARSGPQDGVPARTARRYRQKYGRDALGMYLEAQFRKTREAALVREGKSKGAAQKWVHRHPGAAHGESPPLDPPQRTPPERPGKS